MIISKFFLKIALWYYPLSTNMVLWSQYESLGLARSLKQVSRPIPPNIRPVHGTWSNNRKEYNYRSGKIS